MIEIKKLSYYLNRKAVLEDINLTIQDGEFASIIGPNGGGKTTLLKIILGQIKGWSGIVLIDGQTNHAWLKKNIIGYLPQQERLEHDFPASALEVVLMGLAGKKKPGRFLGKIERQQALTAMERTGCAAVYDRPIGVLSGGEMQRVLLARALVSGSKYLFLDEPEAGVDLKSTDIIYKIMKQEQKAGKTIVDISHNIAAISRYSTSMICLNHSLHCHSAPELINAEVMSKTFGDVMRIVERTRHD